MFKTGHVDIMERYENEEIWYLLFKLGLLINKDPNLKPKKADDFKKSIGNINRIKENARKLQDNDKYFEIILMADEIEETLMADLKNHKKALSKEP